jgi:hypothetical protein
MGRCIYDLAHCIFVFIIFYHLCFYHQRAWPSIFQVFLLTLLALYFTINQGAFLYVVNVEWVK